MVLQISYEVVSRLASEMPLNERIAIDLAILVEASCGIIEHV